MCNIYHKIAIRTCTKITFLEWVILDVATQKTKGQPSRWNGCDSYHRHYPPCIRLLSTYSMAPVAGFGSPGLLFCRTDGETKSSALIGDGIRPRSSYPSDSQWSFGLAIVIAPTRTNHISTRLNHISTRVPTCPNTTTAPSLRSVRGLHFTGMQECLCSIGGSGVRVGLIDRTKERMEDIDIMSTISLFLAPPIQHSFF